MSTADGDDESIKIYLVAVLNTEWKFRVVGQGCQGALNAIAMNCDVNMA